MKCGLELWVNGISDRKHHPNEVVQEVGTKGCHYHKRALKMDASSYLGWLGFTTGYVYLALACPIDGYQKV